MSSSHPDYPNSVQLCQTSGTGLQTPILDIGESFQSGYPPVIQIVISNTATVVVNAAFDVTASATPTLVNPQDVSNGGFTGSDFYNLIPGLRFYQINVIANTGLVTVKAGQIAGRGLPQILRMVNSATQGM